MSREDLPKWASLCLLPEGVEAFVPGVDSEGKPNPPQVLEGSLVDCLSSWKETVQDVKHLALALSASDLLCMVLDLPTQDREELSSMVDLQAEELSPFPPERTQVSWEVLKTLKPGGTRVLLSLLPMQKLEDLHEALTSTVGVPSRIDVDVLGWLNELSSGEDFPREEDSWILLCTHQNVMLIAWHQGTPVLIRSLGDRSECTAEVIQEELQQARIPMETVFPTAKLAACHLWYTGRLPEWAGEGSPLNEIIVHPIEADLSAAQGVLNRSREPDVLDLTPVVWKQEVQAQARLRHVLKTAGIGLGVWALLLGSFVGWAGYRSHQVKQLEEENQRQGATVEEIRVLSDQIQSLSQFTDRSQSALEALKVIAEAVPGSGGLEVEDFRYKKQGEMFFKLKTGNRASANRFYESLVASGKMNVLEPDFNLNRQELNMTTEWKGRAGP